MAYNKPLPPAKPLPLAKPLPSKPLPSRTVPTSTYKTSTVPSSSHVYTTSTSQVRSPPSQTHTIPRQRSNISRPNVDCSCCTSNDKYQYQQRTFEHLDNESLAFLYYVRNKKVDMYCMMGFYLRTSQYSSIPMALWKVVTVGALQTFGLYSLYQENSSGFCSRTRNTGLKFLCLLFALYITIDLSSKIRFIHRYSMYTLGKNQPLWINKFWVGIGLWINIFVLLFAWIVSCILIIAASKAQDPALEVTLNALAALFIIDFDTEIITWRDYENTADWFAYKYGSFNKGLTGQCLDGLGDLLLNILNLWEKPCMIQCNTGRVGGACHGLFCQMTVLEWVLLPMQVVLPLMVFICS